jgi:hypothetical protein
MSTSLGSQRWLLVAISTILALGSVAIIILGFSYESLRRQMAGISSDLARYPSPTVSVEHSEVRSFIIRSKLSRAPDPIVVMGDSIVEAADLPKSICGHPVVNAGIGGMTIGYFVRNASLLLQNTKPALVVLAVGVNDATGSTVDRVEPFRAAYQATIQSLGDIPFLIATIPPIGPGAVLFRTSLIDQFNAVIRQLAAQPIDLYKALTGDFTTADGVHLNAAGYDVWDAEIVNAVDRSLGCK